MDGVSCDLMRMYAEPSNGSPSPVLEILTVLINTSLRLGATLPSWRKAIISMIPKRKDDGTFTSLINEMRPISVLQEFGKISAKLLSNRLGEILLAYPKILNSAQRAFLRDGCTSQCITTVLNVLEDFKGKGGGSLFLLAYDQVRHTIVSTPLRPCQSRKVQLSRVVYFLCYFKSFRRKELFQNLLWAN